MRTSGTLLAITVLSALAACAPEKPADPRCDAGNGGIELPSGFCATVFADKVGVARHIVVRANGDVYVALESARRSSANTTQISGALGGGAIAALRDTNNDGRADIIRRFGTDGGSGLALRGDTLYFSTSTTVMRYVLAAGELVPALAPDTIVTGFPDRGGHNSRSLAFDDTGALYVNIGSGSNVCRSNGGSMGSPGNDPCRELSIRAGIWRFNTKTSGQQFVGATPFATGIRNAVGLTWNTETHALYATQHGRDGLWQMWPQLYTRDKSADTPSEILMRVSMGDNYGWPYCYHDRVLGRNVLAPEYGGNADSVGRCATMNAPIFAFPGHWAPDGLQFYTGSAFPAKYRGGAFIAFHGSWNRPASKQAGFLVAFLPFTNGAPGKDFEVFADGFADGKMQPGGAEHRPVGLAEAADGALFVTDDQRGRVWRIVYVGATGN